MKFSAESGFTLKRELLTGSIHPRWDRGFVETFNKFRRMDSFKKIGANVIYQGFGRLISSFSSFLITVLVARSFGPDSLGDLTKVLSFVALFYLISDFGFNAIVIKDATEDKKNEKYYFSSLCTLRVVFSLFLILLVLLIDLFLPYNTSLNTGFSFQIKIGIALASLTILTQSLLITANAFFQYKLRYDKSAIALLFGSLVTVFLAYGLVKFLYTGWPEALLPVISSYVVGGAIASLIALKFTNISCGIKLHESLVFTKNMIARTWPIGLTLIFNLVYFRVDMIILALVRNSQEVGLYSLAYKVFDLMLVFPIFLINASYPSMISSYSKSLKDLKIFSKKIFFILLVFSLAGLLVVYIFSPQIIEIFGSGNFEGSVTALRILIVSLPVFYITALLMWILITLEYQKYLIYIYSSGAILNIILNIIFIPQYGYLSAAVITVVSEIYILLASLGFLLKAK